MTTTKSRKRASVRIAQANVPGREELTEALDAVAEAIKATNNHSLLPIFERLETEIANLEDATAVLARAMKRTKKRKPRK